MAFFDMKNQMAQSFGSCESSSDSEVFMSDSSCKLRFPASWRTLSSSKGSVKYEDATYEAISVELSNGMTMDAVKAGYGPALAILKTMTRAEREAMMKHLFVKRPMQSAGTFNEEVDCREILFGRIYGIQKRTSSALRSCRVLRRPTWIHTILKVASTLETSARFFVSNGDWRLPMRITCQMSSKQAVTELQNGLYSQLLEKAEHKFYEKMTKHIQARLGKKLVAALYMKLIKSEELTAFTPQILVKINDSTIEEKDANLVDMVFEEFNMLKTSIRIGQIKPGFGKYSLLLVMIKLLQKTTEAQSPEGSTQSFSYTNQKQLLKKMSLVGAKDAVFGITIGTTVSLINPLLGLPMTALSLTNLTLGSTELQMIEPVCQMMVQQLRLAAKGQEI